VLSQRVARLEDGGLLGDQTVESATLQFHALCEGLATVERRGIARRATLTASGAPASEP
jgi:hypothetical protein